MAPHFCTEVNKRGAYFMESKKTYDCIFVMGPGTNQELIQCHKIILAMASPVFEKMFFGELCEMGDVIHVADMHPIPFKLFLHYIYTNNANITTINEAGALYGCAKKYMMERLLDTCKSYLWHNLAIHNVWNIFQFAQLYEDRYLLLKCEKIICTYTAQVLNQESIKDATLKTLVTVFGFDSLNINSELVLIEALARLAEAHNIKRYEKIFQLDSHYELSIENWNKLILHNELNAREAINTNLNIGQQLNLSECNDFKLNSDDELNGREAADSTLDSYEEENSVEIGDDLDNFFVKKADDEQSQSDSETASSFDSDISESEKERMLLHLLFPRIVEKIRFLCLNSKEFADCAARSTVLSKTEEIAVKMNLVSRSCGVPMPTGFSTSTINRHSIVRFCYSETQKEGIFIYKIQGFDDIQCVLSPPFYVRSQPWQLIVTKKSKGSGYGVSVRCSCPSKLEWHCEADVTVSVLMDQAFRDHCIESKRHIFCSENNKVSFTTSNVNWDLYKNKEGAMTFRMQIISEPFCCEKYCSCPVKKHLKNKVTNIK